MIPKASSRASIVDSVSPRGPGREEGASGAVAMVTFSDNVNVVHLGPSDGEGGRSSGGFDGVSTAGSVSEDDPDKSEREYAEGKGSRIGAVANITNTIVGAGIVGLPFALSETGLVAGVILVCIAALMGRKAHIMLIDCGELTGLLNYEELMQKVFGAAGFVGFCTMTGIFAFGAMCAYLIIIGDTIPLIAEHTNGGDHAVFTDREAVVTIFAFFAILPLCLVRDLHHLSWSSIISVLADLLLIFIVLGIGPNVVKQDYPGTTVSDALTGVRPSLFAGLGAISFAFVSQSSAFLLYRSMKKRSVSVWREVISSALGLAFVMGILLGVGGYLLFAGDTQGDILNNLPVTNVSANAARGFLAVTMVLTYPLEMYVARHMLDAMLCTRLMGWGPTSLARHIVWTFLIWFGTLIVAISTDDLGFVLEIFGAFAGSTLGYIFPSVLYLQVHRRSVEVSLLAWNKGSIEYKPSLWGRTKALRRWYPAMAMLSFGIVAMVAGTVTTLVQNV